MRRIPSFFALRAFEAAARLRSFSLAGEELRLTPSAISHQIRALEEQFGRPLFTRRHRGIDVTPEGERLQSALSSAFDSIEAACAEIGQGNTSGSLAIHCSPSFAARWLGPRLPDFMRLHPALGIRLSSGAEPVNLLRHGDLDIVIAYGAAPAQPGIVTHPLGREEVAALCTQALAAGFDPDDRAAASRLPLIESPVSPIRWADWFSANGYVPPPPRMLPSFDRGALAIAAAVQGVGVALESKRFAAEELASGQLVELGAGRCRSIRRHLHFLCYRQAQEHTPPIVAFRDWLLGQC